MWGFQWGRVPGRRLSCVHRLPSVGSVPGQIRGWVYMGLGPFQSEGARESGSGVGYLLTGELRKLMVYQEAQASDPSSGEVGYGFLALL